MTSPRSNRPTTPTTATSPAPNETTPTTPPTPPAATRAPTPTVPPATTETATATPKCATAPPAETPNAALATTGTAPTLPTATVNAIEIGIDTGIIPDHALAPAHVIETEIDIANTAPRAPIALRTQHLRILTPLPTPTLGLHVAIVRTAAAIHLDIALVSAKDIVIATEIARTNRPHAPHANVPTALHHPSLTLPTLPRMLMLVWTTKAGVIARAEQNTLILTPKGRGGMVWHLENASATVRDIGTELGKGRRSVRGRRLQLPKQQGRIRIQGSARRGIVSV